MVLRRELTWLQEFNGQVLHSTQFKVATDHAGKKVAVVGSCTSGISTITLDFKFS